MLRTKSLQGGLVNKTINLTAQGQLEVLQRDVFYTQDPTELFHHLCKDKADTLLLESAEVESKENLKSLLLVDAAMRIECRGHQVVLTANSDNGQALLARLVSNLNPDFITENNDSKLVVNFNAPDDNLDEDSRLRQPSSFDMLRIIKQSYNCADHDPMALFIGGLFAYDLVANFEPLGQAEINSQCPDYVFYVAETLIVVDHQQQQAHLFGSLFDANAATRTTLDKRLQTIETEMKQVQPAPSAVKLESCDVSVSVSDEEFCQTVRDLKEFVIRGDVFQVVPSRYFSLPCPSSLAAYKHLKKSNPSPYMFYMQDELFTLFGASPESALKYETQTNQVEIYPIAGTRRRGKNVDGSINFDLDSRIELELRLDRKENAEHMMLVDLARNDVARISQAGTRHVADLLKVDRYSHVMHLVSRVVGQLREDLDSLHAYQASMNMGTLTGAPKIRAMQLIRDVEQQRRGTYGGAVGYMTGHGDLDTCIVIRSAYVENGIAKVQAGAGVVFDSDPQAEADETRGKAQAVISAIQAAHTEVKHG
ncbi:anthranilate synthase component I [Vibrio halioticoli NBRC 102217]|uniref:Anthranilate synthase component 1 n=1 Tax=Vibrio halioticoli NBRC 102217 TaxID=1219072 RepID=V5FLS9_9VIBR|nr:anthranilate synthase component 1 [Vibrio halioticoli]GAD90621.1 anthranilate synthase component I [Vibrio halioticoli NBRC 102217]